MTLYFFIFEAEPEGSPAQKRTDSVLATVIVKGTEADSAEARARDEVAAKGHVITRVAVARVPLVPRELYGIGEASRRQIAEAERSGAGMRFLPLHKAAPGGKAAS